MKLSKTQQELLNDLKMGDFLHYMPYMGSYNPTSYYFMHKTMNHYKLATVDKLIKLGYLEEFDREIYSGNHKVRLKSIPTQENK